MNFRQVNTDHFNTTERKVFILIAFLFNSTLHVTWIAANIKSAARYPLGLIIYCLPQFTNMVLAVPQMEIPNNCERRVRWPQYWHINRFARLA